MLITCWVGMIRLKNHPDGRTFFLLKSQMCQGRHIELGGNSSALNEYQGCHPSKISTSKVGNLSRE